MMVSPKILGSANMNIWCFKWYILDNTFNTNYKSGCKYQQKEKPSVKTVLLLLFSTPTPVRCYATMVLAMALCLSQVSVLSNPQDWFLAWRLSLTYPTWYYKEMYKKGYSPLQLYLKLWTSKICPQHLYHQNVLSTWLDTGRCSKHDKLDCRSTKLTIPVTVDG